MKLSTCKHDDTMIFYILFAFVDTKPFSMAQYPPADEPYQQTSTKLTLENSDLWKTFHGFETEMIITKHGR